MTRQITSSTEDRRLRISAQLLLIVILNQYKNSLYMEQSLIQGMQVCRCGQPLTISSTASFTPPGSSAPTPPVCCPRWRAATIAHRFDIQGDAKSCSWNQSDRSEPSIFADSCDEVHEIVQDIAATLSYGNRQRTTSVAVVSGGWFKYAVSA